MYESVLADNSGSLEIVVFFLPYRIHSRSLIDPACQHPDFLEKAKELKCSEGVRMHKYVHHFRLALNSFKYFWDLFLVPLNKN